MIGQQALREVAAMGSKAYSQMFVHLVWATKGRTPLITQDLRPQLYGCIRRQCRQKNAEILAIGGVEDHVHLLIALPTTVSVTDLIQQVKGASSHFVTHVATNHEYFEWQHGYGAFTIHRSQIPRIAAYIENQESHHRQGTVLSGLERASVDDNTI